MRARCHELGVKQCLTKPIGQSELLDAILLALGQGAVEERLIESPGSAAEKKPKGGALNILLSEDNPVNQKLAIRLLEKAGHRVTLASTGREAVAAWESAGRLDLTSCSWTSRCRRWMAWKRLRRFGAAKKNPESTFPSWP